MKKQLLVMAAVLNLGLSVSAKENARTNMVLAASKVGCGGYLSLEKLQDTTLRLFVNLSADSKCNRIGIDSLSLEYSLVNKKSAIQINPRLLGTALPVEINDEVVVLDLSNSTTSQQIATAHTKEELADIAAQQAEIESRQRTNEAVGTAAVGGAVILGAGATAAAAAASSER